MDAVKEAEGAEILFVSADAPFFRYQPQKNDVYLRLTSP